MDINAKQNQPLDAAWCILNATYLQNTKSFVTFLNERNIDLDVLSDVVRGICSKRTISRGPRTGQVVRTWVSFTLSKTERTALAEAVAGLPAKVILAARNFNKNGAGQTMFSLVLAPGEADTTTTINGVECSYRGHWFDCYNENKWVLDFIREVKPEALVGLDTQEYFLEG